MTNINLDSIATEVQEIDENGVAFEDTMLTWNTAEDVKAVVDALNDNKIVHYLKLDGNTLGVEAAAAIGTALELHPEFKKALWRNMFTRRLKTEIPLALKHLGAGLMKASAKLTILDLSDNALGPNGMVGLEDLLRSPTCYSLKELRLNNCGLGIGGGQMLSKALLDCHRTSTAAGTPLRLQVFITGRNRLENDGAKAIAKIFATLKTLEEIAMPQNSIYHDGIAALAEGFKENHNLRVLNLNDNTITYKGAASLAEAFAHTPNLEEINFGDCLLRTNGAYHFAEALDDNHMRLKSVDLSYNEIKSDGALALLSSLQNKPNLQRIHLDGNQFGSTGRDRIKHEMTNFPHADALESLDEDQSECEDDDDNDIDEDDEGDDDDDDDQDYGDEEEYIDNIYGNSNHTDEDDEEYLNDSAYTTTPAFNTKMLAANETLNSLKSVTITSDENSSEKNSVETFCLSRTPCTLEMFESLKVPNKLGSFKEIINDFTEDNHVLLLIFTALKCGHLAQVSSDALEVAVALFQECCDYAVAHKQERRILNYILVQLGLLRTEQNFSFKPLYNVNGTRYALRETLKQNLIKSEYMVNAFDCFLKEAGF